MKKIIVKGIVLFLVGAILLSSSAEARRVRVPLVLRIEGFLASADFIDKYWAELERGIVFEAEEGYETTHAEIIRVGKVIIVSIIGPKAKDYADKVQNIAKPLYMNKVRELEITTQIVYIKTPEHDVMHDFSLLTLSEKERRIVACDIVNGGDGLGDTLLMQDVEQDLKYLQEVLTAQFSLLVSSEEKQAILKGLCCGKDGFLQELRNLRNKYEPKLADTSGDYILIDNAAPVGIYLSRRYVEYIVSLTAEVISFLEESEAPTLLYRLFYYKYISPKLIFSPDGRINWLPGHSADN